MWKVILLFSFVLFTFGSDLKERFSLKVKVVGRIAEEKPKLLPPKRISLPGEARYLDLSYRVLEPPKYIEEAELLVPEGKGGCGEPKDRAYYRAGVRYYKRGELKKAETRLLDLLSLQKSPFIPQAQYLLGLVYYRMKRFEEAKGMFERSCYAVHPYRDASCEALIALRLMEGEEIEGVTGYDLWDKVLDIKSKKKLSLPDCKKTVFKRYCSYVEDFVKGNVNEDYPESTSLRRVIVLIGKGEYSEAENILKNLTGKRFRAEALYYLGVLKAKKGKEKEAYRIASLLETLDPFLARELHGFIAGRDPLLSRLAYRITGSKEALIASAVLFYNSGNYRLSYREFLEAGDPLPAVWSAVMLGDYERAYRALKFLKPKAKEHYLWTLEVLYWTGREEEMVNILRAIKENFPDLYREYMGWYLFRKGRWEEASRYFKDPYHKALALYNAGKYGEVIKVLESSNGYKERILKAKASVSMGKGDLARKFLTGKTKEEVYLLGMSYFIEGKYEKAIEQFRKITDKDEVGRRALLRIGDSLYNLGRYEEAKGVYKEILKGFPDSKEATEATLALAQIELQVPSFDLKELVREFERRFPKSPLIPDLRYQLALLYLREGEREKAKEILEGLLKNESLRPKVLLKLASLEEEPLKKESMLREVLKTGSPEQKEEAMKMLTDLFYERGEFEKLADLLAEGGYQEKKKALTIYMEHNLEKAVNLFEEMLRQRPEDEDLKVLALSMYEKTKGKRYLEIARESSDPKVRAEALYKLGKAVRLKDKRKALEYFVEVVLLPEKVQPFYNLSILEAVDILVKMKARRDASCLLARIDEDQLSKEQAKKVKILRSKLPKCEVK